MIKNRLLVIYTEGETDEEFYRKLLIEIRKNNDNKSFAFKKIEFYSAQGIMRFQNKIISNFKKEYCIDKYRSYEKVVCLCYDSDVFEYASKPPINWGEVEKSLSELGADNIIKIVANHCIEDFFLYDIEGVRRYLRLARNQIPQNYQSLELLKQMFKKAGRQYYKGYRVAGLVDSLNISKIAQKICPQIYSLCLELGYKCDGSKCRNK
jgi:hypothetical protein